MTTQLFPLWFVNTVVTNYRNGTWNCSHVNMKLDEKGAEALLGVEGGKEYDKNVLYDILNK